MLPLSSLLDSGKTILTVGITAALVGLSAWALHSWSVSRLEARQKTELAGLQTTLQNQCQKDKQITEEASREYQNQLTDLRGQLATVKRVQPNRCISTPTRPASGRDGAATNAQLPHPDGVFTDDLFDFAADAEQVGRQLDACQSFIKKAWESRDSH